MGKVDKELLAKGIQLANWALEKFKNRRGRTSKSEAPEIPPDVKPQTRIAAQVSGWPIYSIYALINCGVLSPYLALEIDWILIEKILPKLSRSEILIHATLSRMPKNMRAELIENAGETKSERFIRRKIEQNPNIRTKVLLIELLEAFPRLAERSESYIDELCEKITISRRRHQAKMRYKEKVIPLTAEEIDFFRLNLLAWHDDAMARYLNTQLTATMGWEEFEELQGNIVAVEKVLKTNSLKTKAQFQPIFNKLKLTPMQFDLVAEKLRNRLIDFGVEGLTEIEKHTATYYSATLLSMNATALIQVAAWLNTAEARRELEFCLMAFLDESTCSKETDTQKARQSLDNIHDLQINEIENLLEWVRQLCNSLL